MNPLTKTLLVLLRIAIGWHLCYEGCSKLASQSTRRPFSAEMYLRTAAGPLRHRFREIVEDFHGLEQLEWENPAAQWRGWMARVCDYYGYDAQQRSQAEQVLTAQIARLRDYLNEEKTKRTLEAYRKATEQWEIADQRARSLFDWQTLQEEQRKLDAQRRELSAPISGLGETLRSEILALANDSQRAKSSPVESWHELSQLEKVNLTTMYGLLVLGGCLLAGLFSRLSALAAAGLLLSFYLAHPPWPGLPPNPMAEGSYMFVDKNVVEILALLVLATVPTGIWAGADALVRGLITRPVFRVGARELSGAR